MGDPLETAGFRRLAENLPGTQSKEIPPSIYQLSAGLASPACRNPQASERTCAIASGSSRPRSRKASTDSDRRIVTAGPAVLPAERHRETRRGWRSAARGRTATARGCRGRRVRSRPTSMPRSTSSKPSRSDASCRQSSHRLPNDRLIGHFDVADDVFLAGGLRGKHGREQVVGAHPLQMRRHALAVLRAAAAAAPASRSSASGSLKNGTARNACTSTSRATCDGTSWNICSSGKLCWAPSDSTMPLSSAEACSSKSNDRQNRLRMRQAPGPIDARAERRVDDELHAARFVEEPFEEQLASASAPCRWPRTARRHSRPPARPRTGCSVAGFHQPIDGQPVARLLASQAAAARRIFAQPADFGGKLERSARRFAAARTESSAARRGRR